MFDNIWIEKYRPQTLDQIVLSKNVREFLDNVKKTQEIPHLLFCGLPGGGKTSLAKIIAKDLLNVSYLYINASDERGIDTVRTKVTAFAQTKSIDGKLKVIILDEMDGLTSDAQRALRNTMEEYADNVRFILTANSISRIIGPIKSRAIFFDLVPPLEESMAFCIGVLKKEGVKVEGNKERVIELIKGCYPDIRKTLNALSKHVKDGVLSITEEVDDTSFAKEVFKKVVDTKVTDMDLRKFVIENEIEFGNDYNALLKGIFDVVFDSSIDDQKKREAMLILSEGLYRHCFVMDFEINAYCTLLKLKKMF